MNGFVFCKTFAHVHCFDLSENTCETIRSEILAVERLLFGGSSLEVEEVNLIRLHLSLRVEGTGPVRRLCLEYRPWTTLCLLYCTSRCDNIL